MGKCEEFASATDRKPGTGAPPGETREGSLEPERKHRKVLLRVKVVSTFRPPLRLKGRTIVHEYSE
jgi:hypothetical protein